MRAVLAVLLLLPLMSLAQEDSAAETVDLPPEPPAPTTDQVVPVAEEIDEEVDEEFSGPPADNAALLPLTPAEQLEQTFGQYKEFLEAGILDEADAAAKQVVQLTIELTGTRSSETAKALTNLGIVQHLAQDYESAQQNFSAAVDIIEENEDRLNSQLINPLTGLGKAQLEGGRPDLASQTYERAVHVTHVNDGPHNIDQVDLLESLAEANVRLGDLEQAKLLQDRIYALNLRYSKADSLDIVPALMRRAAWQHRTGFIYDERTSYRTAIRVIEDIKGKDDLMLVEPLIRLGRSYFYLDTSGTQTFTDPAISGEIYFKRAVRIAAESEASDWRLIARASLALGDYYMNTSNPQRARQVYKSVWNLLSEDDSRLDARREWLEQLVPVKVDSIPQYVRGDDEEDEAPDYEENLREGQITVSYDVSERGRVANLKLVEARPAEFTNMQRLVQRELRRRIYRPRFEDAVPVKTTGQTLRHTFYFRAQDLEALQKDKAETVAASD